MARFLTAIGELRERLTERLLLKRWGIVVPGLIYRSGQLRAGMIERTLRKYGIRVILNLRGRRGSSPEHVREAEVARALDIRLISLPLKGDGTGELAQYFRAIQHMVAAERDSNPLLVHCAAGAQRTGGVVAAYRLLIQKVPPELVYDEMRRYGWKPDNTALLDYLNDNMAELAHMLAEAQVIDGVPDPAPSLGATPRRTSRRPLLS